MREGEKLNSAELPTRLSTGSLVRQQELKGERLCFELLCGDGPHKGWVSLKLKAWKAFLLLWVAGQGPCGALQ